MPQTDRSSGTRLNPTQQQQLDDGSVARRINQKPRTESTRFEGPASPVTFWGAQSEGVRSEWDSGDKTNGMATRAHSFIILRRDWLADSGTGTEQVLSLHEAHYKFRNETEIK